MNCWHCNTELIWGSDHDISEETENFSILTNLHCPNCGCDVDVWYPKENSDDQERVLGMDENLSSKRKR